jgi:hypothetical protein
MRDRRRPSAALAPDLDRRRRVTPLARALGPWIAFTSPRRGELARAVLVSLVLLAASPFHAPFSTFDQGHHGHAHSQVAAAQKSSQQQSATDVAVQDLSAAPVERVVDTPAVAIRGVGGLRTLRAILRL